MQRTIEIADFELPRGAVPIQDLISGPRATWDHLRGEINLRRRQDPSRPLARCRLCEGPVFIRSHASGGTHSPVYTHYPESPRDCPWHDGPNLVQDDARAAQYRGHQESALHRWLCTRIEQLLRMDPRCQTTTVGRYLRPSIEKRGRYPDIYAELNGLGRFAIEVQLAKPFAPEVAARHIHYEAEGVHLIWVFRELPVVLPQGFHDVISMQRGNAFLFDQAAEAASIDGGKLTFTAVLENDREGWLKPRLVSLDELNLRSGRSVFLEDRRTKALRAHCKAARAIWSEAFEEVGAGERDYSFGHPCFARAWDSIKKYVPALSPWKHEMGWTARIAAEHLAELVAILFSIVQTAAQGDDRLFLTRYRGPGALVAMLNAKLGSQDFRAYATLMETVLANTPTRDRLERPTLIATIRTAKSNALQIAEGHPVWEAATRLFPEVLDGLRRAELQDLGRLPHWAGGARSRVAA